MTEPPRLLLGVDVGTFETKATLTTDDGSIVDTSCSAHCISHPAPGWAEHDAERVWWGGLVRTVSDLLTRHPGHSIAGVGVSGIGPCVLPVDDNMSPLRPAILYGIDTRAADEQADLSARIGTDQLLSRCGNTLTSQSAGPKIAWLRAHCQEITDKATAYLTCQSFLVARLTGSLVIDHLTASYFHPLYDIARQDWNLEGVEDIVDRAQLPALAWSTEVAGSITPKAASQTGIPIGTPVAVGTADAAAEAVAAGVHDPSRVMLMYGSSGFLIAPVRHPSPRPSVYTAPGLLPGTWLQAGGTTTAGSAVRWALDLAGRKGSTEDFDEFVAAASSAPPGAHGLLFLAQLAGERTPVDDPHASAALVGLTLRHTRADIARAMVEGVAHAQAWALETLIGRDHGREIVAIGGGTRNPVWTQAVSDITGSVQRVVHSPGASVGDAWIAGRAVGVLSDRWADEPWPTRSVAEVRPAASDAGASHRHDYASDQQTYRRLDAAMRWLRTERTQVDDISH